MVTDHAYAAERYATRCGAELVTVVVPLESGDDELLDAVAASVDERAAVLVVDQITSPTAMVFPIAPLVALARSEGVPIVVDGAHAPALLDAPVADEPDFWTGAFHKWACAPRGTAGLYASGPWREKTLPPVVSWSEHGSYTERFDQQGTQDYVPWLAAPTALEALTELRWPARRVARDLHAELALTGHSGRAYVRLSAHAYNDWHEYERLAVDLPSVL